MITGNETYCCCCGQEFDQEKSIKNQTDYMKKLGCFNDNDIYKKVCWGCYPDVIG